MKGRDDVVSASEIASWAWCPESWRLDSLGHEPENRTAIRDGETFHARMADFETDSRTAMAVGWCLIIAGLLVAWAVYVLVRA